MDKKKIVIGVVGLGLLYFVISNVYVNVRDLHTLTIYGNVDIRDVALGFKVPGRIAELKFEEGDKVKLGDALAMLDKESFQEDYAITQAQLEEARAELTNAEKVFERRKNLRNTGFVSEQLYDDALAQKNEAQARVKTAEVKVDLSETSLKDTEILAPNDGMILSRVREPGSIVSPSQTVYTMALNRPVWVRTYVSEPDLGEVYNGKEAEVFTDTNPNKPYKGKIGFISPQAEFTPKNVETKELRTDLVYRLRVIIDDPDDHIRQGMPVTVIIKRG